MEDKTEKITMNGEVMTLCRIFPAAEIRSKCITYHRQKLQRVYPALPTPALHPKPSDDDLDLLVHNPAVEKLALGGFFGSGNVSQHMVRKVEEMN